jgi:hypothetical protein
VRLGGSFAAALLSVSECESTLVTADEALQYF